MVLVSKESEADDEGEVCMKQLTLKLILAAPVATRRLRVGA